MTDNEIIKALECCYTNDSNDCYHCPYTAENTSEMFCDKKLEKDALDLINRQNAENIALNRRAIPPRGHILKVGNALLFAENKEDYDTTINKIKSEAIKEFADRLKEKAYLDDGVTGFQDVIVAIEDIDNLVAELTVNYESSKQRKDEGKND